MDAFVFPKGMKAPKLLADLAKFAGQQEDFFTGHVEIGPDTPAPEAGTPLARLVAFAREGDGSTYALWLADGTTPETAPVVYLNSEGDGDQVVAGSLSEFLQLLTLDLDEIGFMVGPGNWAKEAIAQRKEEQPSDGTEAFRAWAEKRGIEVPTAAQAARITKEASERHPHFAKWLQAARESAAPPSARKVETASVPKLESGALAFELKCSPKQLDDGCAHFLDAIRGAHPELTIKSKTWLKGGPGLSRKEQVETTKKLPADLLEVSSVYLEFKDTALEFTVVVEPKKGHRDVTLWMKHHPDQDAAYQSPRALFEASFGRVGKVLLRRGNAA